MKLMDGILTAQIASAKSVHHLDGMVIATVMIISILKIVNGTEEIAVGMFKQTSVLIAHVLILHSQQQLPLQQQPQLQPPPLHHLKVVDPLVGLRINGVMTRTIMPARWCALFTFTIIAIGVPSIVIIKATSSTIPIAFGIIVLVIAPLILSPTMGSTTFRWCNGGGCSCGCCCSGSCC